jgi:hypothetical protein
MTTSLKRALIVLGAVVVLAVGLALAFSAGKSSPPPAHVGSAPACLPDPSKAINATPAGGTWNGGGKCYSTQGVLVTASHIGITNATFKDPQTTNPGPKAGGFKSIVQLSGTTGVTLSDLTITGANPTGKYTAKLVNEAGIKLIQTTDTAITNVAVSDTFGDCLEVWALPPGQVRPNTNVTVDGFTANNCGRMLMSPSDVYGMTVSHFTGGASGYAGIDFESDTKFGAGNVTISDSTWSGTIIEEKLTGPLTFTDDTHGGVGVPVKATAYPVIFQGGTLTIRQKSNPAGIWVWAGSGAVTFDHYTFQRDGSPGAAKALLWKVNTTGHLTITNSKLSAPLGSSQPNVVLSGNTGG